MDKVRVIRILEYVGDRDLVEKTLNNSNVPINGSKNMGNISIASSVIGDLFEIIGSRENTQEVSSIVDECRNVHSLIILPDREVLYEVGTGMGISKIVPFVELGAVWFLIYQKDARQPFARVEGSGLIVMYY